MDRQVLEIKQREAQDGKKVDYYSFKPLLRQLEVLFKQNSFSVEKDVAKRCQCVDIN